MEQRTVPDAEAGERLDAWLARAEPRHSRARWQQLLRDGRVRVDGEARKPNHRLAGGESVAWEEPPPEPAPLVPEARPLRVLYEDADVLVLDKPPDCVVHPAPGHATGTLVHALLHHCSDLAGIGGERRPGIVHRLDRDTSGVMVVAKNETAMRRLVEQFKEHTVRKEYLALAWGRPEPESGRIETPIGRHPVDRKRMSVDAPTGRHAVTLYETVERFRDAALLRVRIETGRTHQIRVHLAHLGHPVVGDATYGRARGRRVPVPVARQMLHAARLAFTHPGTGEPVEFEAPAPPDLRDAIRALRREAADA
jgi:23S rRNA pseudouridine1911/1915/1917 synthase